MEDLKIVRLTQDYTFSDFDCGEEDLNDFLLKDAKDYLKYLLSVTYIIENNNDIVGYFSVSNDRIGFSDTEKAIWRKIKTSFPHRKHRKDYPAVKIGRLAINKKYQGKNIGTFILQFVQSMFLNNNRTGCCFVTLDALPKALEFYKKNGFIPLAKDILTEKDTIPMYYNLTRVQI